jgi:hypothetical protein
MGLDNLPAEVKTLQQAIDHFAQMDGVTDHEFIEHEPVQHMGPPWTKTLWTVNKGTIICHMLYERDHDEDPFSWYFRAYTESAGPCMINCPLRMLEATKMPLEDWAFNWRCDVLNYHGVKYPETKKYLPS